MSTSDNYFTFPLSVLHGNNSRTTPLECLERALAYGMWSAGRGFRNKYGDARFVGKLNEISDDFGDDDGIDPLCEEAEYLLGASICNVDLDFSNFSFLTHQVRQAQSVKSGGPLVRMASRSLWAALNQARFEADPTIDRPDHRMSWREFRVLAAILSVRMNSSKFAFIGWETIQAKSCGYAKKAEFSTAFRSRNGGKIPAHLEPLTRKQIRKTCDDLEGLGFYARFRLSTGSRGGLMAYSFRHDRAALGKAVCDFANFLDRSRVATNREDDAAKCMELLTRAKSEPSGVQPKGQVGGQVGGQHNENFSDDEIP